MVTLSYVCSNHHCALSLLRHLCGGRHEDLFDNFLIHSFTIKESVLNTKWIRIHILTCYLRQKGKYLTLTDADKCLLRHLCNEAFKQPVTPEAHFMAKAFKVLLSVKWTTSSSLNIRKGPSRSCHKLTLSQTLTLWPLVFVFLWLRLMSVLALLILNHVKSVS